MNGWRRTIQLEAAGLCSLEIALEHSTEFPKAIEAILRADRVVVTGMGKSGCVGQKVAATLSSTGTPACFIHPADAAHGDLGMIKKNDCVIAFSWSGETPELEHIVNYCARFAVCLIAVTSVKDSSLGKAASVVLEMPECEEASPFGLVPTTSTIIQQALGDCIAMALIEERGFTREDFKDLHPGGKLGAKLKHVSELMHKEVPLVMRDTPMSDAIVTMSERAFGCVGVIEHGELQGIITDGDLRRHVKDTNFLTLSAGDVMTKSPKTVAPDALAAEALEIMNAHEITALFVIGHGRPIGIVHLHDLLRAGVA